MLSELSDSSCGVYKAISDVFNVKDVVYTSCAITFRKAHKRCARQAVSDQIDSTYENRLEQRRTYRWPVSVFVDELQVWLSAHHHTVQSIPITITSGRYEVFHYTLYAPKDYKTIR